MNNVEQKLTFDHSSRTEIADYPLQKIENESNININNLQKEFLIPSGFIKESKGKHVQTLTARVLDWDDNIVKTEVIINREEGLYEVRTFPIEVFDKTELLKHGHILKILMFIKQKAISIMIEDGEPFVSKDIFPQERLLKDLKSELFNF